MSQDAKAKNVPSTYPAFHRKPFLLGMLISVTLGVVLLSQIEPAKVLQSLSGLDGPSLVLPLVISLVGYPLRPWRWMVTFPARARPSFQSCFAVLSIGNFANNLLPARGGDLLRCILIVHGNTAMKSGLALATLGLEKVFDGFALLLLIFLAFAWLSPPSWIAGAGILSGLLFGTAITLLVFLRTYPEPFILLIRKGCWKLNFNTLAERLSQFLESFVQGLEVLVSPRQIVYLGFLTILVWVAEAGIIWALATTLDIPLRFEVAALVAAVLGLGLMIPSAPGFIGTYEFVSVAAMVPFGIDIDHALGLTLLMHGWSMVFTSTFGLIGLGLCSLSLTHLLAPTTWLPSGRKG